MKSAAQSGSLGDFIVGHSGRDGPSEQLLMLNARPVLIYQQVELARGQGVEFFIR
jgi:hypothetical protein